MSKSKRRNEDWKRVAEKLATVSDIEAEVQAAVASEDPAFRQMLIESNLYELQGLLEEVQQREQEALSIYEPMPSQAPVHRSKSFIRLVRGSNRGGKTQTTHVELARAICGCDPYKKYPKKGVAYAVGLDFDHIGKVMWAKLSSWGTFRIIKDPATKRWRAFRRTSSWDVAHEALAKPAPPLIPQRLIVDVAWEERKKNIPNKVTLPDWELNFYSSKAQAPQGFAVNLVLFDEEIVGERWYLESIRGLVEQHGSFIWGATAQHSTELLYSLYQRAHDPDDPDVAEFFLHIDNNVYIDKKAKKQFFDSMTSEEERRVRYDGGFSLSGQFVYPTYNPSVEAHGVEPFGIPTDWCLYAVIDPGVQVCAVAFLAVPPDERAVFLYDELYLKRADAMKFGKEMARKCAGRRFEAFIADWHMLRQTQMGSGKSLEWHYRKALEENGVQSRKTGSGFIPGSDNIADREESLRRWLEPREDTGRPTLQVFTRCQHFTSEMKAQLYKKDPTTGLVLDKRIDKNNHLVTCVEYAAAYRPRYVAPELRMANESEIARSLIAKRKKKKQESNKKPIRLGPGGDRVF